MTRSPPPPMLIPPTIDLAIERVAIQRARGFAIDDMRWLAGGFVEVRPGIWQQTRPGDKLVGVLCV